MKRIFKKPYLYFTIGIFLLYLLMNFLISGFYDTIPLIIAYANSVNWLKLGFSIILSLIIGILVAINGVYVYMKYKERKECAGGATAAGAGTIGGLITGFCPLCITGLFPLIFGLFGVSFSLASLPFQGIEIQLAVIVLLFVSLKMLNKSSSIL